MDFLARLQLSHLILVSLLINNILAGPIAYHQAIQGWTSEQAHFQHTNLISNSNSPQSFIFTPTKTLSQISSAGLSLCGFNFLYSESWSFQTQLSIPTSHTVQIDIYSLSSITNIYYLKYFILCIEDQLDKYFLFINDGFTFSSISTNSNSPSSQTVYSSLPVSWVSGSQTIFYMPTYFSGQVYGGTALIFSYTSIAYDLGFHSIRCNIRRDFGSLTKLGVSIMILSHTQAQNDVLPFSLYSLAKYTPVTYLESSSVPFSSWLQNDFDLPSDRSPFYQRSFFRFMYVRLYADPFSSKKQFSFQLDQNQYHDSKIDLAPNIDYFQVQHLIITKAFCSLANQYFLSGASTCSSCTMPANCVTCNGPTSCGKCVAGFFVDGTTCTICPLSNCDLCATVSQCQSCQTQYFKNSGGTCQRCDVYLSYCLTCSLSTTCQICYAGYYSTGPTCQTCVSSMPQCQQCDSSSICTLCNINYFTEGANCLLCSDHLSQCITCVDSTQCLTCSNEYFLRNGLCVSCMEQISGCLKCSDPTQCTECVSDLYMIDQNSQCVLCSQKLDNCIRCINKNVCIQCRSGYFTEGAQCLKCSDYISGCNQCTTSRSCNIYEQSSSTDNSQLINQFDEQMQNFAQKIQEMQGLSMVIVVIIVLLIIGLIGIGLFVIKKLPKFPTINPQISQNKQKISINNSSQINIQKLDTTNILSEQHLKLQNPNINKRRKRKKLPKLESKKNIIIEQKQQNFEVEQVVFDKQLQDVDKINDY